MLVRLLEDTEWMSVFCFRTEFKPKWSSKHVWELFLLTKKKHRQNDNFLESMRQKNQR